MDTVDLPLKCACGSVKGIARGVSPSTVNRIVCYCVDCQAFAQWLGRDDIVDPQGGTDISQLSPAQVAFTDGLERLAAMRLSEKGLLRWYTSCCRTPIGNTMASASPPFLGLIARFVDHAADGRQRDAVMGPAVKVQIGSAKGDRSALGPDRVPVRVIARSMRMMIRWWIRGDAKRSPLFSGGVPRAAPTVLTEEERRGL